MKQAPQIEDFEQDDEEIDKADKALLLIIFGLIAGFWGNVQAEIPDVLATSGIAKLLGPTGAAQRFERHAQKSFIPLAQRAARETTRTQAAMVRLGNDQTVEAIRKFAGAKNVTDLTDKEQRDLIGFASDGTPLLDLFKEIAPETGEAAREAAIAVRTAELPKTAAQNEVREALANPMNRVLTAARTESMKAYRKAAHRVMQRNAHVIGGWIWFAHLDNRTCPVCWAMHGTFHSLDEELDSHPNCRCTAKPVENEASSPIKTGVAEFAKLNPTEQEEILGPKKFTLWQEGKITLADVVEPTHSPRWGPGRKQANIAESLENAKKRTA